MSFRTIILIMLIVACFAGAAWVRYAKVDDMRAQWSDKIYFKGAADPQIVLATNLLGGFRGYIVDVLWFRAIQLQQSGRYWELYQLYDWISKLEPRLEEVWANNGWNMSYNLVAMLPDGESRWVWIERAISWLRDDGLRANPGSGVIMRQLSFIFWHKMGREMDFFHDYYKHRWALKMHFLLGGRSEQNLEAVVKAPGTLAELLKQPVVADALAKFVLDPPEPDVAKIDEVEALYEIPGRVTDAVSNNKAASDAIRYYVAKRVLRHVYKMDPQYMLDIELGAERPDGFREGGFGKMDWRLPEPHAIYWALLARDTDLIQTTDPAKIKQKRIEYLRLITFSAQQMARRGVITYLSQDPNEPMVVNFDLSKIQPIIDYYDTRLFAEYNPLDYGAESLRDAQLTFLEDCIFHLHWAGYKQEAQRYFNIARERYNKPPAHFADAEEWCVARVKEFVEKTGTGEKVSALVDGLIFNTCYSLATADYQNSRIYEEYARAIWTHHLLWIQQSMAREGKEPLQMLTFEQKERAMVLQILNGKTPFPREYLGALAKELNITSPEQIKQWEPTQGITRPPTSTSPPKMIN